MYQPGTEFIIIADHTYSLRLSLGALAEISDRFEASGPIELAARLRRLSLSDTRELLACLLRPSIPRNAPRMDAGKLAAQLSDEDLQAALPKLCRMIEHAFGEMS